MSNHCGLMSTPTCLLTSDRDTRAAKQFSPLWIALKRNSMDLLREALAEDSEIAQVPLMDHRWEPPLCAAIRFGCSHEMVKLLFEHKSDVNQCDAQGRSVFCVLLSKAQGARQAPAHEQSQLAKNHLSRCPPIGPLNVGPSRSSIWEPNWDAVPIFQDTLLGFAGGNLWPIGMENSAPQLSDFSFDRVRNSKQDDLLKVAALLLITGASIEWVIHLHHAKSSTRMIYMIPSACAFCMTGLILPHLDCCFIRSRSISTVIHVEIFRRLCANCIMEIGSM